MAHYVNGCMRACEENLFFTLISLQRQNDEIFVSECGKSFEKRKKEKKERIEWHKSMMSHENFPFLLFVHSNFHTCHFFHKVLTMKIYIHEEREKD